MTTYIDITELARNPVRSGIQRTVREFIKRVCPSEAYTACIFDPELLNLVELPAPAVEVLCEKSDDIRRLPAHEIERLVSEIIKDHPKSVVAHNDTKIFIPELFYEVNRVKHYRWRLDNPTNEIFALFYDFIPWISPDNIGVVRSSGLMPYFLFSMEIKNAAFISERSFDQWRARVVRDRSRRGIVLPLGSDGLRLEKQSFDREKKNIICLGSLDGRKNQDVIAQAFVPLWRDGIDLNLVLIGYAFDQSSKTVRTVREIQSGYPGLRHMENASDVDVLDELRQARATIYMSEIEGYGLPPVESLYARIPAIVSNGIPSTDRLSPLGQIRVDGINPTSIETALRQIADDTTAEKLWSECAKQHLPTWDEFTFETENWLRGPSFIAA